MHALGQCSFDQETGHHVGFGYVCADAQNGICVAQNIQLAFKSAVFFGHLVEHSRRHAIFGAGDHPAFEAVGKEFLEHCQRFGR